MRRAILVPFVLVSIAAAQSTACSSTNRIIYVDDAGAPAEEGPAAVETVEDGGDASTATPKTPKEQCEALIACVADIEPSSAGALVTLYGDASNCWTGSDGDAAACGKACAKAISDRPKCMAEPLARHYLALCAANPFGGPPLRFDVDLVFHPRDGGKATFRPLPARTPTYRSSGALSTSPVMTLRIDDEGGTGEITTPFELPAAAFGTEGSMGSSTVERVAVQR
jgi:hypothetical protein